MSYASDLAKLKRAVARNKSGPAVDYVCSHCSAKPAPMTRFGPRCAKHRPHDENCAAINIKIRYRPRSLRTGPCDCGLEAEIARAGR